MTAENFNEVLTTLRQRKPFQVFTVILHGGERFEVDLADALVIRGGVAVFLRPGGGPMVFDHDSVLQFILAQSDAAW